MPAVGLSEGVEMAGGASGKEGGDGEVEGVPTRNGACAKDGGGEVSRTARGGSNPPVPNTIDGQLVRKHVDVESDEVE